MSGKCYCLWLGGIMDELIVYLELRLGEVQLVS